MTVCQLPSAVSNHNVHKINTWHQLRWACGCRADLRFIKANDAGIPIGCPARSRSRDPELKKPQVAERLRESSGDVKVLQLWLCLFRCGIWTCERGRGVHANDIVRELRQSLRHKRGSGQGSRR